MKVTRKDQKLFDAFVAGIMATGEGFNGEYPFENFTPEAIQSDELVIERFERYLEKWASKGM